MSESYQADSLQSFKFRRNHPEYRRMASGGGYNGL